MAGLDLVGPYLTKVAIDRYIRQGQRERAWTRSRSSTWARSCSPSSSRFGQVFILQMTGQKVMMDLRREIYAHLQRLHVGFFDQNPVGRLMTRVTTDVDAVNELFTSGVVTVSATSSRCSGSWA
jgi:ATP-binding cassette subfamily B protein